jgi:hypothetical protein
MAWTAVIFVLALEGTGWGAAAPAPKTVAADQPYEQEQPGEKTIVAVVQNVETYERSMTVLDTWGQATMFDLGAASIYTSSKNYEELAAVERRQSAAHDLRLHDLFAVVLQHLHTAGARRDDD